MRRSERLPSEVTFWRVIFVEYVRFDRANAYEASIVAHHAELRAFRSFPEGHRQMLMLMISDF
jgi:hypothetical protein